MPSHPDDIGFRRGDYPEFMGWAEVVAGSKRSDSAVRQMRREMEDFPVPVQILSISPLYLADEVRNFFKRHPRRTVVDAELITQMQGLYAGGATFSRIAELCDVSVRTVYNHLAGPTA